MVIGHRCLGITVLGHPPVFDELRTDMAPAIFGDAQFMTELPDIELPVRGPSERPGQNQPRFGAQMAQAKYRFRDRGE